MSEEGWMYLQGEREGVGVDRGGGGGGGGVGVWGSTSLFEYLLNIFNKQANKKQQQQHQNTPHDHKEIKLI